MQRKRHYRKRGPFHLKLKKQTVYTVAAVWLWLFSAAIFLSFFGEGTALSQLRDAIYTKIGPILYPLPVYLISVSFLFFKVKSTLGKPNIPLGFSLLLFSLLGLTQSGMYGEWLMATSANAISIEGAFLLFIGIVKCPLIIGTIVFPFLDFLNLMAEMIIFKTL